MGTLGGSPIAKEFGIDLDGWHAFRRSVATALLRSGASAKLVSGILGNSVEVLLKAYALSEVDNFRTPSTQFGFGCLILY